MKEESFQELRAKRPTKTIQEIHDSIPYKEGPDGMLYPDLKMDDDGKVMDRWARLAEPYLKADDPSHYSYLEATGQIVTYLLEVSEQYQKAIDRYFDRLMKRNPAPVDPNILIVAQHRNSLMEQARELATEEVLKNLH